MYLAVKLPEMTLLGVWNTKIKMTARDALATWTEEAKLGWMGELQRQLFFEFALTQESIAVNEAAPGVVDLHSHSAGRAETNLTIGNPP